METNQKIETQFRAALDATPQEREKSDDLSTGFNRQEDTWEIIVKHTGNLGSLAKRYPNITIIELLNNYGILQLPADLIDQIANEDIITYIEKPKRLFFEMTEAKQSACINTLQARIPTLSGRGTLVGIIDSGIDYAHPDFCNPNGTTRIVALWDQTISSMSFPSYMLTEQQYNETDVLKPPSPPQDYPIGTLYTSDIINQALLVSDPQVRYSICPSQDLSGHGTHVNGRKNKK